MNRILRFCVGFVAITSFCINVADPSITLGTCQLSCSQNENQLPTAVGPQGPPGKRGPVGADGRSGPSGPTGPPGACIKCDQLEEENMNLQRTLLALHERLYPQDCIAVKRFASSNGIYLVYPSGGTTQGLQVYCDQFTDNGGWIVMQRRMDGSEDFYRDWDDYIRGFGDKRREFWLGLETVYRLTVNQSYEIRFDFVAKTGEKLFAKYSIFKLESADDNYRLTVTGYSGDAGDSMHIHNQRQFTTKGRDHDRDPNANDAEKYKGAWWYSYGHHANLNGLYSGRSSDGLSWYKWKDSWTPFLKAVEMKIRRIE